MMEEKLVALNTRDVKQIKKKIDEHWGCDFQGDYFWFKSSSDKLYVISKDATKIDFSKLRIDSVGMYFARESDDGLRLSIEGSQLVGKIAAKNMLEIDEYEIKEWLSGQELSTIDMDLSNISGYVIIKHKNDFFGCGKVTQNSILNFVPKVRRV
jgi:NOL1/NOP2/fmu family ribosome biogenesis protein